MGFFSWLASGAASGLVKGFGGVAADLRKMRLDAEVAMAQTESAREKEQLRAEIERLDRMVQLNEQANSHMQSLMQETWMKYPMFGIMACAFLWVAAAVARSLYNYGAPIEMDPQMVDILTSVIYSMFGVGGALLLGNRLR